MHVSISFAGKLMLLSILILFGFFFVEYQQTDVTTSINLCLIYRKLCMYALVM